MAILSKPQLLEVVVQSIYDCGWQVLYLNQSHPFELKIFDGEESQKLKIIIYNLSHGGGRQRPSNEYRIQLKVPNITQPIGYRTLILGYWGDVDVFAGFDNSKHKIPGHSSSAQIKDETLRKAKVNGFSAQDKGNGEIAIAFTPDFFVEYVKNYEQLHSFGESATEIEILEEIVASEDIVINDETLNQVAQKRREAVVSIKKKKRDSSFTRRVLTAYSHKCAVCDLQLKLIDASHIVPVSEKYSTDETNNGIALCALHHRAYDKSLITFNEKYQIIHNKKRMQNLKDVGHDSGMNKFIRDLKPIINLPPDINDRPHINYVSRANEIRGW